MRIDFSVFSLFLLTVRCILATGNGFLSKVSVWTIVRSIQLSVAMNSNVKGITHSRGKDLDTKATSLEAG